MRAFRFYMRVHASRKHGFQSSPVFEHFFSLRGLLLQETLGRYILRPLVWPLPSVRQVVPKQ